MSEVWYRVDYSWDITITPVKAERLTDKTITPVNGYTERKESKGRRYFENFDDAATFANSRMAIKRELAEQEMNRVEKYETELWVSIQRIRDAIKDGVL